MEILSNVKSKMPGIHFDFNVDIDFCKSKCVTKNAVGVSNGSALFFLLLILRVLFERRWEDQFSVQRTVCNFLTMGSNLIIFL